MKKEAATAATPLRALEEPEPFTQNTVQGQKSLPDFSTNLSVPDKAPNQRPTCDGITTLPVETHLRDGEAVVASFAARQASQGAQTNLPVPAQADARGSARMPVRVGTLGEARVCESVSVVTAGNVLRDVESPAWSSQARGGQTFTNQKEGDANAKVGPCATASTIAAPSEFDPAWLAADKKDSGEIGGVI